MLRSVMTINLISTTHYHLMTQKGTHAASNTNKKVKQVPVRGGKKEKPTSRNAKSAWKRREKADASKHNAEGPTKNLLRRCKEAPSKMYRHNLTGTHCNPQSRVEEGKANNFSNLVGFQRFCMLHGINQHSSRSHLILRYSKNPRSQELESLFFGIFQGNSLYRHPLFLFIVRVHARDRNELREM